MNVVIRICYASLWEFDNFTTINSFEIRRPINRIKL